MTSYDVIKDTPIRTTYKTDNGLTRSLGNPCQKLRDHIRRQGFEHLMSKRPQFNE